MIFADFLHLIAILMEKVKDSRDRPGVAQSVPGGLGFQIFMTLGT